MDPNALDLIVECDACLEPAAPDAGCRCGASAIGLRSSGGIATREGPYRAPPSLSAIRLLPFELACAARGAELERLSTEWREAKAQLLEPHDEEVELRATWLAAVLSATHAERGDRARERALLETAWSRMTLPLYRATLAARLARKHAREGSLDRAEAWLKSAYPRTGTREVDADVEVARAVLAQARGEDDLAMEIVGAAPSSRRIGGSARVVAAVVRLSVLEKRDDQIGARRVQHAAAAEHGETRVAQVAGRLDLARKTHPRLAKRIAAVAVTIACAGAAIAWVVIAGGS